MKKLIPIAIACLFAISTQAQNTPPASTPSSTKAAPAQAAPAPAKTSHDGVMMKDGKMWVSKDGKTTPMTADMTMSNGTKVMSDGSYMTKDGKKMMLKNGDAMGMDGKVMKAEAPKKEAAPKAAPSK